MYNEENSQAFKIPINMKYILYYILKEFFKQECIYSKHSAKETILKNPRFLAATEERGKLVFTTEVASVGFNSF